MKKMFLFLIVIISILPLSAVYHKIGEYDTPGSAYSVFVSNNIAYVAEYWGSVLRIIDVSNPQNPFLLGYYNTPGYTSSVFVSNNIAYVAAWGYGLLIIDVSNPQNPFLLGSYYTSSGAKYVTVSNNIAYVADYSAGLQIIDVSNPQIHFCLALMIQLVMLTPFLFHIILHMWQMGILAYKL